MLYKWVVCAILGDLHSTVQYHWVICTWGGLPYKDRDACQKFEKKKNLRGTKILFGGWGHGLKFFLPHLNPNSKTKHYLLSLKGTAKSPTVVLLRMNTLRYTKTTFLTPKRYDKHPCPFHL